MDQNNKRPGKPIGLGAKKSKTAVEEPSEQGKETNQGLYFELPPDASQLDELKAMLELAESVTDEPEKAIPLLRGIIHECDAIVRSHNTDEADDNSVSKVPMDAAFWTLYGDAMVLLGQMEFREEAPQVSEFVRQALEFYEHALEETEGDEREVLVKLAVTSCLLFVLDEDEAFEEERIKSAFSKKLEKAQLGNLLSGILEAAMEANSSDRIITLLDPVFSLLKDQELDEELSLIRLRLANYLVEAKLELIVERNDNEQVDEAQFDSEVVQVGEFCDLNIEQCQDESNEGFLVKGEALMLRASALELLNNPTDPDERDKQVDILYAQAREYLEKAQSHGIVLPESLSKFLEEE